MPCARLLPDMERMKIGSVFTCLLWITSCWIMTLFHHRKASRRESCSRQLKRWQQKGHTITHRSSLMRQAHSLLNTMHPMVLLLYYLLYGACCSTVSIGGMIPPLSTPSSKAQASKHHLIFPYPSRTFHPYLRGWASRGHHKPPGSFTQWNRSRQQLANKRKAKPNIRVVE